MLLLEMINNALGRKSTSAYVWLLACLLLFASHVHIANMLGWNGRLWPEYPLLWQVMDVLLLGFDVVVAAGLIFRKAWAVIMFFAGLLVLQIVPFTLFRKFFVEKPSDGNLLNSLLAVEIILMLILLVLIMIQGSTPEPADDK